MRTGYRLGICAVLLFCLTACGCKAGKAYNKGVQAYKDGAYEEALECFDTAISLNPNKAEYYIERGKTLTELSRYEEARAAFLRAVVEHDMELIRKNNKRANLGIGITYFHEENYAQAKEYLEKAREEELLPDWDESITIYLTETCRMLGQKEEALALYATWLTKEKGTPVDFYNRGMLRLEMEDAAGSLEDFEQAISADPEKFSYYLGKINALAAAGRENEREETLKIAAGLLELSSDEVYYLAKELFLYGAPEAEELFERSAEGGSSGANYFLGEIVLERGEYAKAAEYYKRYLASSGKEDGFAYNQLAVCQAEQKEYQTALQTINTGLSYCNSKNEEELLYNRIVVLEKLGEFKTAYENAVKYSGMFPENEKLRQELTYLTGLLK